MSIFDERALRTVVAEEVRKVLREELGDRASSRNSEGEYLPVTAAAAIAAVTPATIRAWASMGRLRRFFAGRELRVLRSELESLLARPASEPHADAPERAADEFVARRLRSRATKTGAARS